MAVNSPTTEHKGTFKAVLVDTGTTHTVIPASLAEDWGVEPLDDKPVQVRVADGRIVDVGRASVHISIPGYSNTPIPCVVFLWPNDKYLIGCTTLENHGLKVNPTTERLEEAEYEI